MDQAIDKNQDLPVNHSSHSSNPVGGVGLGIPIATILEYKAKGLSNKDIANLLNCDASNITHRLKPYRQELDTLDNYIDNRANTFAAFQHILLNSIQPDDIKRMSPSARITGAAILYDKERLERGKSTANVSYQGLMNDASTLQQEIAELRRELGMDTIDVTPQDEPEGG